MTSIRERLMQLAAAPGDVQREILDSLSATDPRALAEHWGSQALPGQIEPKGEWRNWLIMAGRGFGKTRIGAEWVLEQARRHSAVRVALVGASLDEVAKVVVEGDSGILRCARAHERLGWRATTGKLSLPNRGLAIAYSGASPDGLRGPQHHFAWADEIAKWAYPEESWANLQLGLRLGSAPRVVVTTTPGKGGYCNRSSTMWRPMSAEGGRSTMSTFPMPSSRRCARCMAAQGWAGRNWMGCCLGRRRTHCGAAR